MSGLSDVMARLGAASDSARRCTVVLEWTMATLGADGAALYAAPAGLHGTFETRIALGTLAPMAPLLAAELSRTGIPPASSILAVPGGSSGSFLCCPLGIERGESWSALVFQGNDIENRAKARQADLAEALEALRGALEEERTAAGRSVNAPEPGSVLAGSGRPAAPAVGDLLPNLAVLTEGLRLPLYACSPRGAFTYASPGFLLLTGYPSLEALQASGSFFQEPEQRAAELAALRRQGKVESFPLLVKSGSEALLQIRDSAVVLGDTVFGMFFDVTGLMAANAELKDALQIQELLNDSILAGANQLQRTQGAAIRALARLAEYRDPETGFHLQRICEYSRLIAVEVHVRAPYAFRITMEYANDISLSCMLHDVGKVSIPDHILLKPGKLDPDEWDVMKKHTLFGWEVLHKADRELGEQSFLTLAASIALSHHERYDGTGYPNGTAGEQIPLSARITAVADVYDALTSARPYKKAWSHERASQEIIQEAGGHFDPALVTIFSELASQFADVRRRFPG